MVAEHPEAEIVESVIQSRRVESAMRALQSPEKTFRDLHKCIKEHRPDIAILCQATASCEIRRTSGTTKCIFVEKPFAASLSEADRMIAAAKKNKVMMAINWPLRWSPVHCTISPVARGSHRRLAGGALL
jgi:glucose-fructose oxidoreductase